MLLFILRHSHYKDLATELKCPIEMNGIGENWPKGSKVGQIFAPSNFAHV